MTLAGQYDRDIHCYAGCNLYRHGNVKVRVLYKHGTPGTSIHLQSEPHGKVNSLRPSDAYMRHYTNHHWFRQWLVAWSAPSHYLNQCWFIVNWNFWNKLHWNPNRNSYIFIQENAFENVVRKMTAILFRPKCVEWVVINYKPVMT